MEENKMYANKSLQWGFGRELYTLPKHEKNRGIFKPKPTLTKKFQDYLDNIGEVCGINFFHEKTKDPSEFGVTTRGKCSLGNGIELTVKDAWSYHVVGINFASEELYLKNADVILHAAKIPGVRGDGHCGQKDGYNMLEREIIRVRDFTPEEIIDKDLKKNPGGLRIIKDLRKLNSEEEAREYLINEVKKERRQPSVVYHIDNSAAFLAALHKFKEDFSS